MAFGQLGIGFGRLGLVKNKKSAAVVIPNTITAGTGIFLLTGDSLTPAVDYKSVSDLGTFALTGNAANVRQTATVLASATGTYAETGNAATLTYVPAGGGSVITSITQGTITIGAAALTNTFTSLPSVNTAKTILIWNGTTSTTAASSNDSRSAVRIALTNGTTVTATRESSTDSVTVAFTAVEFASGVNSIQSGVIAITSTNTSNTATITTVGANAFVIFQGSSESTNIGGNLAPVGLVLTNSTTVTANVNSNGSGTQNVGYTVVDLDSTIVTSVQPKAVALTSGTTTDNDTLSAVTTANTLLMYAGNTSVVSPSFGLQAYTLQLNSTTNVLKTRVGGATSSRTNYYTAVQLTGAALSGNIQRGTIALASATSNTATITSVTTSKSFVNWNNFSVTAGNANVSFPTLTLTNATTVTAAVNTAGTLTAAYEVVQFA